MVIGIALLGIAALRELPRWAAVLLVIGSLGMLGYNDQNAQALMVIPFGIGGYVSAHLACSLSLLED